MEHGANHISLTEYREQIDLIDHELVRLLSERATCALAIASIKRASGLEIFNADREKQVLEQVKSQNDGPYSDVQLSHIFNTIMATSREIQGGEHTPKDNTCTRPHYPVNRGKRAW